MNPAPTQLHPWIAAQRGRLAGQNYTIFDAPDPFIAMAARHSGFELLKFGNVDTFFVFSQFPELDLEGLRAFSSRSFAWANRNKGVNLPNGFFEAVTCFTVAVTDVAHPALQEAVRNGVPEKHWGAFEIPVVYETSRNVLYYFEKTPLWGAAYYNGFRNQIKSKLF